ncbi:MAG TPA: thymidylate synthase [Paludibacter sp.]|nr:thymidylate synthase [Paludibacter sp.]
MIKADKFFIENINEILQNGYWDENSRPKYADGVEAKSKFITQVFEKYDISKNEFPITTLRNTAIKTGIKEILWIYQKQTNSLEIAHELGINWWDEWDIGNATIGNRYGYTVNKYNLMNELLDGLAKNPFGRRHILNLYQYSDLYETKGLYPCAYETLWSARKVDDDIYLDVTLVQRSSDYLVANYINKTQYVALMLIVCSYLGYKPGVFGHFVQNLHIYDRHFDAVNELLSREPLDVQPTIKLIENKSFGEFTVDDFIIENTEKINKIKSKLELAI